MGEETTVKASAIAAQVTEVRWRCYPHLDAALGNVKPAVLTNMEKTRTGLDQLSRVGTEREKERARAALAAYSHALALYHQLVDLREHGR
jgi:hypothetical protein